MKRALDYMLPPRQRIALLLVSWVATVAWWVLFLPAPAHASEGHTPVSICHLVGHGNYQLLTVDDDAVDAHLDHGDYPLPSFEGAECASDPVPGDEPQDPGKDCFGVTVPSDFECQEAPPSTSTTTTTIPELTTTTTTVSPVAPTTTSTAPSSSSTPTAPSSGSTSSTPTPSSSSRAPELPRTGLSSMDLLVIGLLLLGTGAGLLGLALALFEAGE